MNKNEKLMTEEQNSKRKSSWICLVIVLILVVVGIVWWTGNLDRVLGGSSWTASDMYQAVFLTNDQVYFGKLTNADSQYPRLTDVFYLQVTQTLQPIGDAEASTPQQNINLIKLGGELHGPSDAMVINRDHILFFEDMKEDSQVVTAIRQYKESQENQ